MLVSVRVPAADRGIRRDGFRMHSLYRIRAPIFVLHRFFVHFLSASFCHWLQSRGFRVTPWSMNCGLTDQNGTVIRPITNKSFNTVPF